VLTCDPDRVRDFWLNEYAPEVLAAEARRYPPIADVAKRIGRARSRCAPCLFRWTAGTASMKHTTAAPSDCWTRGARLACSRGSFVEPAVAQGVRPTPARRPRPRRLGSEVRSSAQQPDF